MSGKKGKGRGLGITNKQASFLASLQREAGERYSGNGMSRQQASQEIDRLRDVRRARSRPGPAGTADGESHGLSVAQRGS